MGEAFLSIYQSKDVTPYIHAFMIHVPEFIALHGNLVSFAHQGLEILAQSNFNKNIELLKQMLEKHNHVENLEDSGYQRIKKVVRVANVRRWDIISNRIKTLNVCNVYNMN